MQLGLPAACRQRIATQVNRFDVQKRLGPFFQGECFSPGHAGGKECPLRSCEARLPFSAYLLVEQRQKNAASRPDAGVSLFCLVSVCNFHHDVLAWAQVLKQEVCQSRARQTSKSGACLHGTRELTKQKKRPEGAKKSRPRVKVYWACVPECSVAAALLASVGERRRGQRDEEMHVWQRIYLRPRVHDAPRIVTEHRQAYIHNIPHSLLVALPLVAHTRSRSRYHPSPRRVPYAGSRHLPTNIMSSSCALKPEPTMADLVESGRHCHVAKKYKHASVLFMKVSCPMSGYQRLRMF